MKKIQTIDDYIALFPSNVQKLLTQMRLLISKVTPEAAETINYGIPTFKLNGRNLVHFGAFKKHIGFYPGSDAMEHFDKDLAKYKRAKGSVQFPFEEKIPVELVKKIVTYRVGQESK